MCRVKQDEIATLPDTEAVNWEPLGKIIGIGTMFLYSIKEAILKELWSVAPVSKIQREEVLPFWLDECEFMKKGKVVIELALAWGVNFDFWSNSKILIYCSWVKPKEGAVDPCGADSDTLLIVAFFEDLHFY